MAEDYAGKSLFNEAGFIIQRLHRLQDRINMVRTNPLLFNPELNCYNYQVWFADLSSLLNEVWGKLTDDEQKEFELQRKTIRQALNTLPIHKTINNAEKNISVLKVDNATWTLIEDSLDSLEKKIRNAMDKHGLGNPDMEGELF